MHWMLTATPLLMIERRFQITISALAVSWCAASTAINAQLPAQRGAVPRNPAHEQQLLSQVKPIDGFSVTLFAAPPVAMYPTCLTSTIDGIVFACVDPNLSLTATKGRGRVVRLVDTNGDGSADTYSVFAEMDSPRGLAYDGQTLYVMHPPNFTAYRDTTGDGIADVSENLVTGLGFDLDFRGADHTTNGITLGIDGWIYIAVGDYGYQRAVGKDGATISHRGGSVVRVRTDGSGLNIYAVGTRNIYDLAVNPLLQVFTRDNTNDGDGWDTRLHYIPQDANMGYPTLYKNFSNEHMPSLADYGSGSGTGGLWVDTPGFPAGFGNTLYTSDWLTNQILRHPLAPHGGSFTVGQDVFLTVPHPADMAMDAQSNMYVASLSGGAYTYQGDSVGYIVRVSPTGMKQVAAPDLARQTDVALRISLVSKSAELRLQAQREILRRGVRAGVVNGLNTIVLNKREPLYGRVAALFTLKQLVGARSQVTLERAVADPVLRAYALRALADHEGQRGPVNRQLFLAALTDTSAAVQMAALSGLARLGGTTAAAAIVPLTASTDAAVAHIAVNTLVSLQAWPTLLSALNSPSITQQAGVFRALRLMHDTALVSALIGKINATSDVNLRNNLVLTLARLDNREAAWTGDWWGTRPAFIGPYFAPVRWDGSARIDSVLLQTLVTSTQPAELLQAFALNRVIPQGAAPLLNSLTSDTVTLRRVGTILIGHATVTAEMIPVLRGLATESATKRVGVAQLLAGESSVSTEAMPLVLAGAADATIGDSARAKLVTMVAALTGRGSTGSATPVIAMTTPISGEATGTAVESAWRRYVGDRRRLQELDAFKELTSSDNANERTLGFAVLLQAVRGNRVAPEVSSKVQPVLAAAWQSHAVSADLARAVHVMRLDAQYTEQLAAQLQLSKNPPAAPMEWKQLFNGKDLKGWQIKFTHHPLGENFRNTFRVEDGLLKVRYDQWPDFNGEFGHVFYSQPFSYYLVAVEYRFIGEQLPSAAAGNGWANRNNGLMLHSQSPQSMGLDQDFPISLENQFLGGLGSGVRSTGNLCTPGTHVVMNDKLITTHCINSSSITYNGDQWVRVEALVLGDSLIKHIVNGDTVLAYRKPRMGGGSANKTLPGVLVDGKALTSGYLALQAETAPIDIRKVEIVNLKGCMNKASKSYRAYYIASEPKECR